MNNKSTNLKVGTTAMGNRGMRNVSKAQQSKSRKDKQTYRTTDSDKYYEIVKHND